jgi:hypothetical protein
MKKLIPTLAIVAALAAAVPAAAAVKPATYKGKTKEGTAITVTVDKKGYAFVQTTLPTTCVSAQGGPPVSRLSVFDTDYEYPIGREVKFKNTNRYPTTHYTVDIRQRRRGRILTGKLALSYSELSYYYDGYRILTCAGNGSFKLRAR